MAVPGSLVSVLISVLVAGCDGRTPLAPTRSPSPIGGVSRPPPTSAEFQTSGIVTDQTRRPVNGARIGIWVDYEILPTTQTDASGHYQLNFTGTWIEPCLGPRPRWHGKLRRVCRRRRAGI